MSNNNLIAIEPGSSTLSVAEVSQQVQQLQDLMRNVLRPDVHFGLIPGCGDRPALLQPGAHKIAMMFNLGPRYRIDTTELENGHKEYEVVCELYHRGTDRFIGEGIGVCSTMESKYRYRWDNTGQEVPQEYWKTKDIDLLGGSSFAPRKTWVNKKQVWLIFQKVEHDNPADYYNTAKKIAKKRAYNDAILAATAASDIFVPDDDTPPEIMTPNDQPEYQPPVSQPASRSGRQGATTDTANTDGDGVRLISDRQVKLVQARMTAGKVSKEAMLSEFWLDSIEEIPADKINDVLAWIEKNSA